MYKIVTHPGSVHKDDFLSTCVLLATLEGAQVFRREPTNADLADPNTYVVDVGLQLVSERHNFDHHQDHSLPCAFHLVMQYLGYHESAMMAFAWYPHMSVMDVRGPYQTADDLGVDSSIFFASSSPIDGYVFSKFAEVDSLSPDEPLYAFMKELGKDMIALIDRKMLRLDRLKQEARVISIKQYKAVVSDIRDSPKLAMELYLRYLDDERIVMSITPSNRGAGWELLRLGDNRMVDFRVIAESPDISFVHSRGFLAKTHVLLAVPEVLTLAGRAIID